MTMDPLTEKQWNAWAQSLIARALDEHSDEMVAATVAYVQDQLNPLREEIAALRADLVVHSGIARSETANLKGRRGKAAA